MVNISQQIKLLWNRSRVLTGTGLLMLAALAIFAAGLALDGRTVTGSPVWLKPAKFAVSTAIFVFTIAWLLRYITVWPRLMRVVAKILATVFVAEVGIIALQAARGVPSHFNASSRFDGALFSIMGIAIGILWLATVAVLAALMRQRFENPAWGWWLRLGVLITVIGSAAGGSMLRMTPEQLAAKRAGTRLVAIGGHTVGAPDGGPGLPGTGWSTEHGDLRIAHFFGLHSMQVLPLLGWLAARRRYTVAVQTRLAFVASVSYTALIAIVWWQALRGQSIVAPDETTFVAYGVWVTLTASALMMVRAAFAVHGLTEARNRA